MLLDYWHKQTTDKPLFPDMQWSRPVNRLGAGKLLIIGGNAYGFAATNEAYIAAGRAGIGTARMLVPDSLRKILGRTFEAGEYAPSTPSGSFGSRALSEAMAMANWANGVLIAGDLGHNSETAILFEKFAGMYKGQLTVCGDALDYCIESPDGCMDSPDTCLVVSMTELQKLGQRAKFTTAFTSDMDLLRLIEALHDFTTLYPGNIIVRHLGAFVVASQGQISTTKSSSNQSSWQVAIAAAAATWWLQNPSKTFAALSTSLVAE